MRNDAKENVLFAPAVKGLVSEGQRIARIIEKENPKKVCLSISPEELEGLKGYEGGSINIEELSNYEQIYAENMQKFGDIDYPPPIYTYSLAAAQEKGIEICAVDMGEESFTGAYCHYVSYTDLLMHSLRVKRLKKAKLDADTPQDMTIELDSIINSIEGFSRLDKKRERMMASRIKEESGKGERILCIIEHERSPGVAKQLLKLGICVSKI